SGGSSRPPEGGTTNKRWPCLAVSVVLAAAFSAAGQSVTLESGKHERQSAIVQFPVDVAAGEYVLKVPDQPAIQVTVDTTKTATLRVTMPAGATWTGKLGPAPGVAGAMVGGQRKGDVVTFVVGGKQALTYQGEKSPLPEGYKPEFQRGGYIHSVMTPGGVLVTDDYPPNHRHHHGVWSPWTKTEFEGRHPDFWNMGDGTGGVEFVAIDSAWSGIASAGVVARHRFVDLSAKPEPKYPLNETWTVRAYPQVKAGQAVNMFDVSLVQTCATESPLKLPKYLYGGMGLRGNRAWDGAANLKVLTSEGKERAAANESRAKWFRASGLVDGKTASIVVLCHPTNFRFPQPLRVHPTEPFICWAPPQMGDFEITKETPYKAQYRYIVADGELPAEAIERLWVDYAEPVTTAVK
ncbi:MAG: PmoA family protein, partial [Tepidisphaerales bacterium]